MYIYELNYPGQWLELENDDIKFEIESLLLLLEGTLTEAAIALSMFEESRSQRPDPRDEWYRDAGLRQQINEEIRNEVGDHYFQNIDAYDILAEKRMRAKKAELGILPRSYLHKIPFIHAHTFVYAVDSFGKFLEALQDYDETPKEVEECLNQFDCLLPWVKKIRNSALHIEDRSRGYGPPWHKKKGKKMEVQGFLGLSILEGNSLCYTIDDGSYQRVEISSNVLGILVSLANRLLVSFEWSGPERIAPS
ncbi:hypothetical protein [Halomonas sp.]|uniref:hypothetical protein n=1 Tax=Halomonas sp. TaxID=1486246 RepID=UPI003850D2A6